MGCYECGGEGGTTVQLCSKCLAKKRAERDEKVALHASSSIPRRSSSSGHGTQIPAKAILAIFLCLLLVVGVGVSLLVNAPKNKTVPQVPISNP